jgi:hypothetical protein
VSEFKPVAMETYSFAIWIAANVLFAITMMNSPIDNLPADDREPVRTTKAPALSSQTRTAMVTVLK